MINSVVLQSGSKWKLHLSSSVSVYLGLILISTQSKCFTSLLLSLFNLFVSFLLLLLLLVLVVEMPFSSWTCRANHFVRLLDFFFNSVVVAVVVRFIWCILCFISCAGCREAFLILLLYQRVWSFALCIAIACGAMILVHRCIAKFATLHKYIAYADHANFVYKPTTKNTDDEHCMQWN